MLKAETKESKFICIKQSKIGDWRKWHRKNRVIIVKSKDPEIKKQNDDDCAAIYAAAF